MNKKRFWILLGSGLLVICGGIITWAVWPNNPPDPATQSPQQIAKYMASKQFAGLDDTKKQDYLSKMGDRRELFRAAGELNEQERQQLRENVGSVFRRDMESRVDRYFELPSDQRTAYLDEMIDRMPNRRGPMTDSANRQPPGVQGQGRRGGGRGFTPERLRRRIENTPPERRAKFAEFMRAYRQRMQERGLSRP